ASVRSVRRLVSGRAVLQRRIQRRRRTRAGVSEAGALQAAAVEGRGVERRGVDVVEAAYVDRDHLVALRIGPARERAHAALRAEQVMDRFLAELVVLKVPGAGAQREARRRHERPQRAALLADRAVAGDDVAEVGRHLETHLAAVA